MSSLLVSLLLAAAVGDGVTQELISEGVTQKVGGYRPIRCEMNEKPEIAKKAPEGLVAPKYGKFTLGDKSWGFIVDELEDKTQKLYVDSNNDGDFTNDEAPAWEAAKRGNFTQYQGQAKVSLSDADKGLIRFYRFDPTDPTRAQLQNTVLFYTDFGYELTFQLDGKEFKSLVSGYPSEGSPLAVDRDGNGRISSRFETVVIGKPFNYTGTTYQIALTDGKLTLDKAETELPQMDMPPDLTLGKQALTFAAKTMDGAEVEFPKSYAGKVVMLDCWATWCGPCIAEIPHMKEAYEAHHESGFEILGVSFDSENMTDKIDAFLKKNEISWAQIYEGKGWQTSIGMAHDVSGIPFVLLVDGDSGEIIGTSRELRGPGLKDYIGKALEKKKAAK